MGILLQIVQWLGWAFFALLVISIAAFYGFLWSVKRKLRRLAGCAPMRTPPRISLRPVPGALWRNRAAIQDYSSQLEALGFKEVGAFAIPEMSGLLLRGYLLASEKLYAAVYDHVRVPPSFDIYCNFADGTNLTATSIPRSLGSALDQCPWKRTLWLSGKSAAEILQAIRAERSPSPRLDVSAEGFVEKFVEAYSRTMSWRLQKGGTSLAEVQRQAAYSSKTYTSAQLETAHDALRSAYLSQVREACLLNFRDQDTRPEDEWDRIEPRLVVIAETFTRAEVIQSLRAGLQLTRELEAALEGLDFPPGAKALAFVDSALAGPLASLGVTKLCELEKPLRACLLLSSETVGAPA